MFVFQISHCVGPMLKAYRMGYASPSAVHFAHRSRRLTIRTTRQMQNEANAMPRVTSKMVMLEF